MTSWRFDILEIDGGRGVTDSHGPLRMFTSIGAAMDEAKAMAEGKLALSVPVEIYTWSNGRAHKIFDSHPGATTRVASATAGRHGPQA